jgi:4-hydroxymandelate oxidase
MLDRRTLLKSAATATAASLLPNTLHAAPAAPSGTTPSSDSAGQDVSLQDVLSLPEFEELAHVRMSHMAYEYVASAAADEHTARWNREAYDRIHLQPRVLRDVSTVDTSVTLLGKTLAFPILLAPTAYHRAIHPEGEIGTARGAGAAGATWVVSTATTTSLEDIARAATAPLWMQLYIQPDKAVTKDLVQRAESVGCQALCLTVDTPVQGARNRQTRAKFKLPDGVTAPYMTQLGSGGHAVADTRRGVVVTWKDVEWLRSIAKVPVLLKGILNADDAAQAVSVGASGILVSNHGGRILDTAPATIEVLPEVVARVDKRVPVLVDGGIRRGTDIVKAVALGADAVLIGRPYCFGLAVGGAAGVQRVIEILRMELEMAMQLMGRRSLAEIDGTALRKNVPS